MNIEKYTALYTPSRIEKITNALVGKDQNLKAMALNSLNHFMAAPIELNVGKQGFDIQAFTRTSDIPEMYTGIYDVFNIVASYDLRCEQAFKTRVFDQYRNFFEIVDITNYFSFDRLYEGEKVSIKYNTGTKAVVYASSYADGLAWTWEMLKNREYSTMIDSAEQFRNAWYMKRSKVLYGILCDAATSSSNANGGTTVPYSTVGSNTLEKDILTLSDSVQKIIDATKDLGIIPDVVAGNYLIYCHPVHEARLKAAVAQTTPNAAAGVTNIRNFTVLPTTNLKKSDGTAIASTKAIMVLQGGKIQMGDKELPQSYMADDITSFSSIMTVKGSYACAVGEPKQTVEFALA
jgi:hypothetical protein